MGNSTGLLEAGFADALRRAAELDSLQNAHPERRSLCPELTETNVELVQENLDFYRQNQDIIDAAIHAFAEFIKTPEGEAHMAALHASVKSGDATSVGAKIASDIFHSSAFDRVRSVDGTMNKNLVKAFGIGGSAGYAAIRGRFAGADYVFDLSSGFHSTARTWKGRSCETGIGSFAGLEFSFWLDSPLTGDTLGFMVDLFAVALPVVVRYMSIRQRPGPDSKGSFAGISLQFMVGEGIGLFIFAAIGGYAGTQTAFDRPEISMLNAATSVNSIAVATKNNTLDVTLTNTPGMSTTIENNGYMVLRLPTFFTDADIADMSINYPGWEVTLDDHNNFVLTAQGSHAWSGSNISFDITGVGSSKTPDNTSEPQTGLVTLSLYKDSNDKLPTVLTTQFDLVWANSNACIQWEAVLNSADFTLVSGYSLSGTTPANAAPGEQVVVLTKARYKDGSIWDLGYVYNYNTQYNATPQIVAAWYKEGAQQRGNNYYTSNPAVTPSCATQGNCQALCYYAGLPDSKSSITLCVVFNPAKACTDTSQYTCGS